MNVLRTCCMILCTALLTPAAAAAWQPCARDCEVLVPDAFEADAEGWRLAPERGEARLRVRAWSDPENPELAEHLRTEWSARLRPSARFDAGPTHVSGISSFGVSGQLPPPPGKIIELDPVRVHVVLFHNERTGSVLLVRSEIRASSWETAWPLLQETLTRVRLGSRF